MLKTGHLRPAVLGFALGALGVTAYAAPMTYTIDSAHTYPSFEVDHSGGVSVWRGKFNSTSGTITMDKEAETGSVDIAIDMSSIDFGHDGLNDHTRGSDPGMLNVAEFPMATYTGMLVDWENGAPTAVEGELTMRGMTLPVNLEIRSFQCGPGRGGSGEVCGADAMGQFNRADFGVNFAEAFGFDMGVELRIQIEARSE
jgi:polyisoprenoid-binding protein YceI